MSFLRRSNLKHVNKHNPFLSSIAQNLFHTFPSSNYQLYLFLVHCWEKCRLELCILCANWMISHLLSFFTWFIHAAWIARACLLYEKKTWAERQTIRPDLFHSSEHCWWFHVHNNVLFGSFITDGKPRPLWSSFYQSNVGGEEGGKHSFVLMQRRFISFKHALLSRFIEVLDINYKRKCNGPHTEFWERDKEYDVIHDIRAWSMILLTSSPSSPCSEESIITFYLLLLYIRITLNNNHIK